MGGNHGDHALVDTMSTKELTEFLAHIKSNVDRTVQGLPEHNTYLASFLLPSQ